MNAPLSTHTMTPFGNFPTYMTSSIYYAYIYIYIAVWIVCAAELQTYNDVYGMPRYKIRITALGLLAP